MLAFNDVTLGGWPHTYSKQAATPDTTTGISLWKLPWRQLANCKRKLKKKKSPSVQRLSWLSSVAHCLCFSLPRSLVPHYECLLHLRTPHQCKDLSTQKALHKCLVMNSGPSLTQYLPSSIPPLSPFNTQGSIPSFLATELTTKMSRNEARADHRAKRD